MDIYELLKKLDIKYEEISHKAIFTVEEGKEIDREMKLEGVACKNLFLKDHKFRYYPKSILMELLD